MSKTEAENFLRNIPWEIEIVLGTQKTNVDGVDTRMLKVTAKEPPKKLLKLGDKWLLVIDKITIYIYIYITKCENRWPLQFQPKKEPPTQNDTGPRKWSADQDKGRIAPFKLRNGIIEEESDMQVDEEEEKPQEAESEITREGTKTLLKRCGESAQMTMQIESMKIG